MGKISREPEVAGRLRILSPESLRLSSDEKILTTITNTDENESDPSVAEPGIFLDAYAVEAKEGGWRGPNSDCHTESTATAGIKFIYT